MDVYPQVQRGILQTITIITTDIAIEQCYTYITMTNVIGDIPLERWRMILMSIEPNRSSYPCFINADSGAEVARQMEQHMLLTTVMGGILAEHPDLSQVRRILDVCCGPGSWVLETAFTYPEIEVIGIDGNQNMINYARAQAHVQGLHNAHFFVMDIREPLDFPAATFDIVNARFIHFFISKYEWPYIIKELARMTTRDGIIRLTDFDELGVSNSPAHEKMKYLYAQACMRNRQSFHQFYGRSHNGLTPLLARFLRDVGCENIQEQAYILNYSTGHSLAVKNYHNFKMLYKLGQPFLLAMGVATQEEIDEVYDQMLLEMQTEGFCAHWYFLSAWGNKPGQ